MANDALGLFGVRESAAEAFLRRLKPELKRLTRHAAAHGADALSIAVMSARIDSAIAAVS